MIRAAEVSDARAVAAIYNHYVEQTVITFEEEAVGIAEMERRIAAITERYPWLVLEQDDRIAGYAYASAWHYRSAYRHSVETTIYCDRSSLGCGVGRQLYTALIDRIRRDGHHCAIASIALPNDASVALHERLGYRMVGQFRELGYKLGRWIDVGYWELLL